MCGEARIPQAPCRPPRPRRPASRRPRPGRCGTPPERILRRASRLAQVGREVHTPRRLQAVLPGEVQEEARLLQRLVRLDGHGTMQAGRRQDALQVLRQEVPPDRGHSSVIRVPLRLVILELLVHRRGPRLIPRGHHALPRHSEPVGAQLHHVAGLQIAGRVQSQPHSSGRPGGDDVAGQQRHAAAQVAHQGGNAEDESQWSRLHTLAVTEPESQLVDPGPRRA
jgi:hypothetical protein